jgi:hypothetical protein
MPGTAQPQAPRQASGDPAGGGWQGAATNIMAALAAAGHRAVAPGRVGPAQDAERAIGNLGEASCTGAQTSVGYTVTDATGRVVAETADLAALRALAAWAAAPMGTGYRRVETG